MDVKFEHVLKQFKNPKNRWEYSWEKIITAG